MVYWPGYPYNPVPSCRHHCVCGLAHYGLPPDTMLPMLDQWPVHTYWHPTQIHRAVVPMTPMGFQTGPIQTPYQPGHCLQASPSTSQTRHYCPWQTCQDLYKVLYNMLTMEETDRPKRLRAPPRREERQEVQSETDMGDQ